MKLKKILEQIEENQNSFLKEDEENKDMNFDDLVKKGIATSEPRLIDKETGKVEWDVMPATNFQQMITYLYKVQREINKYKRVSYPKVTHMAAIISKNITDVISDIKDIRDYIDVVKQGLK
jgi:hypothetical protein